MTRSLTEEIAEMTDSELEALAAQWRARAARGERDAFGPAHLLEVELRKRVRLEGVSEQEKPDAYPARRAWWKFGA